jgi:hydrogenase nickel incorporation protein HypA/HybF
VHELSVSAAVVDTAVRHAAGRRVTRVHLRIGALRQVVPGSLAFYFEIVARETVCEGAVLEQELIAARLRCGDCETQWGADAPAFRCPACAGSAVAVVCGDELEVESIDVEQQEAACTA